MENDKKKKGRLIQFRASEQEYLMLKALQEKFGVRASEYMRSLVRNDFRRAFPAYMRKKDKALSVIDQELTPEQACERAGGKVTVREGIPMCVIPQGALRRYVPLSMPEKF